MTIEELRASVAGRLQVSGLRPDEHMEFYWVGEVLHARRVRTGRPELRRVYRPVEPPLAPPNPRLPLYGAR